MPPLVSTCVTAGLQPSPSQEPQLLPPEQPQSSPTNQPGQPGQPGQPPAAQLQEPVQPFHGHNGAGPDISFPNEVGSWNILWSQFSVLDVETISSTSSGDDPSMYIYQCKNLVLVLRNVMKHRVTTIYFNRLQGGKHIILYHSNYVSTDFRLVP